MNVEYTGQSEPISDAAQRGDQFNQSTAKDIESGQGGSDVSAVGRRLE